jgi:divalent metal cation (Fe/Co/Zn/Cd) transporter
MGAVLGRRRAGQQKKAVAISFWLLAPYVAIESVHKLLTGQQAEAGAFGIVLTAASLVTMPVFGKAKHHLGARLGSGATAGEGTQNLLCAYLAGAVLIGLAANAWFGRWWLDPSSAWSSPPSPYVNASKPGAATAAAEAYSPGWNL